ncbi:ABC transporter permease [Alkalihalobacillus pseudalcaliphilus]|uniref:ABC transporter permease n=1 Tax=Alkalihalobacillus pseudalcaliphilus TaxID=79884 RepID=UPI00064D747C|nr:FtsX-like permease family protein [Alkalihalobacillus pseudalcaliphilus]KMK76252.1 hypothetical protein AB990_13670 [Alkalihalobacillus pseudalcaliphilus]
MKLIKLAFQLVYEQKFRNLLIIFGISLGAIIITSSQIFIASIEESNEISVKELYGEIDLYVGHQLNLSHESKDPVSSNDINQIRSLDQVKELTPVSYPYLGMEIEYEMHDDIYVGFRNEPLAYETTMVEIGEQDIPGPAEVIVSPSYAKSKDINVGDLIQLPFPPNKEQQVKVVGLSEDREYLKRVLVFNYDWLVSVTREGPNMLMLSLDSYRSKQIVGEQINMINPNLNIDFLNEADEQRENIGGLYPILTALNVAILIISGMLLISILQISTQNRLKQYALMRIIGASKRKIFHLSLLESFIIGSIGLLIGIGVGIIAPLLILKNSLSFVDIEITNVSIPWLNIILYSIIYMLLMIASSSIPAMKASQSPPIEVYQNSSKSHAIYRIKHRNFMTGFILCIFISLSSILINHPTLHILSIIALFSLMILSTTYFLHYGFKTCIFFMDKFKVDNYLKLTPLNALKQIQKNKQIAVILLISISISIIGFTTLESMKKTSINQLFNLNPTDYKVTEMAYGNERINSEGFTSELFNRLIELDNVDKHSLFFTKPVMGLTLNLPNQEAGLYSIEESNTRQALVRVVGTDIETLMNTTHTIEGRKDINALEADEAIITLRTANITGYTIGDVVEVLDEVSNDTYQIRIGMIIDNSSMLGEETDFTLLLSSFQMEDIFGIVSHSELLINSSESEIIDQKILESIINELSLQKEVAIYNRYESVNEFLEQYNQRLIILVLAAAFMIGLSIIGLMNNSISSIKERLPELSTLRAIGLSKKRQTYSLIIEGAVLSTICGSIAVMISLWISIHLNLSFNSKIITLPINASFTILLLSPIIGMSAFLAPSIWASRKDILSNIVSRT